LNSCALCGASFGGRGVYRKYCTPACCNRAWRARQPKPEPVPLAPSTCERCGETFQPSRKNQRFCGKACVGLHHRALRARGLHPRRCGHCGVEFQSRTDTHKYCSARCQSRAADARKRPSTKPCRQCGEMFEPGPYERRCKACSVSERVVALSVVPWKGCPECGTGFRLEYRGRAKKFCSRECSYAAQAKRQLGVIRVRPPRVCTGCGETWRPSHGVESQASSLCWPCRKPVADGTVYANVKAHLKKRLVAREGGRCQDCGKSADDVGEPLHAHHEEPQALGGPNTLDNLRLLCPDCHLGSGWWRNHWQLAAAGLVIPPVHAQAA
jgi:hypothetical protein